MRPEHDRRALSPAAKHGSPGQVRVLLRNFLVGFYGFASFCFVLAVGLDPLSTSSAFLAAISAALVVQSSVFALRTRLRSPLRGRVAV